jgi:hypothetical protein
MRIVRIVTVLKWRVFQGPSGAWVGVCDQLTLTVQGNTWAELMGSSVEAVNLLLNDLAETGEFEQFLRSKDWSTVTPGPAPGEQVQFDLPMVLDLEAREALTCK